MTVSELDRDVVFSRGGGDVTHSTGSITVVHTFDLGLRGTLNSQRKSTLNKKSHTWVSTSWNGSLLLHKYVGFYDELFNEFPRISIYQKSVFILFYDLYQSGELFLYKDISTLK